jgi:AcrR family transcriptional regulator
MVIQSIGVCVVVRSERKEREFNTRRAEILAEAERMFAAKGFHNVTMADIANASGFSIGSLYQFFEGKEDLYATMISEKLDLMYQDVRKEVNSVKEVADKISRLIDVHLRFVENNTDFCRIFLRGENETLTEMMTMLRQKLVDDYFKHITFIETFVKSGIKSGYLRKLPTRETALALFHLIRASAMDWMLMPTKEPLIAQGKFIQDIFLYGTKQNDK